jgi:uncharacterized membrane protein
MMSSAGIILIYQAGYASFAFYKLITLSTASVVMPGIVFGSFLLAWFYRSKLLGIVSILGGLAVPLLVSSGENSYRELFMYLITLNIGVLILVNLLRRAPIAWIAFFGTQALFWMWYSNHWTVSNLGYALFFQFAFYAVFLGDTAIAALKPISKKLIPTWDDAMRAVLTPIIFFGSVYVMLETVAYNVVRTGKIFHPGEAFYTFLCNNLGYFAFFMAAWYALLAVLYKRRQTADGRRQQKDSEVSLASAVLHWQAAPSAAVVIALGFVAIGIPLQFETKWITLGWLTVFAGLWYFGHRQTNKTFLVMSVIFFGLGIIRFIDELFGLIGGVRENLEIFPVFNTIALPMLASAAMLIVAAVLTHKFIPKDKNKDQYNAAWDINHFFGILGYILMGVVLSTEAARFFYANLEIWLPYQPEYLLTAFLLGFWFTLAVFLLEIGFVFRSRVLPTVAFCGLTLTVMAMILTGFAHRIEYQEAFNNPFSLVLIGGSLALLALGYQSMFFHTKAQRHEEKSLSMPLCEKSILGVFGVVGLFSLLAILTIEWRYYFQPPIGDPLIPVLRSITLFWTLYALFWITFGFKIRNMPIRICGLIVLLGALTKTTFFDSATYFYRWWDLEWARTWINYKDWDWIPLINPYFLTMLCPVIPALALAAWTNRCCPTYVEDKERIAWKTAGIIGLLALLIHSSVECYQFFDAWTQNLTTPQIAASMASAALTFFWTLAASMLTVLALLYRSQTLRIISMVVLCVAVLKVFGDLTFRPDYIVPFLNPFSAPMIILAVVLLGIGYLWGNRLGNENKGERDVYRFLSFGGVAFLWLVLSVECLLSVQLFAGAELGKYALTLLWTVFATLLALAALKSQSKVLRIFSMVILLIAVLKVFGDLSFRPEYAVAYFNPYALPMILLAVSILVLGYLWACRLGDEDSTERQVYRIFAFFGVFFLWLVMSAECFQSVRLLAGAGPAAWKAQMALSILWSVFAGILIGIGFVWRSATLRWMAILLFAATLLKVLIVDMSGVNELYRFGAVFVLACLLMAATWAYQRFKPE